MSRSRRRPSRLLGDLGDAQETLRRGGAADLYRGGPAPRAPVVPAGNLQSRLNERQGLLPRSSGRPSGTMPRGMNVLPSGPAPVRRPVSVGPQRTGYQAGQPASVGTVQDTLNAPLELGGRGRLNRETGRRKLQAPGSNSDLFNTYRDRLATRRAQGRQAQTARAVGRQQQQAALAQQRQQGQLLRSILGPAMRQDPSAGVGLLSSIMENQRLANQSRDQMAMQDRHFQSQLGLDTRSLDLQAKQAKKQARQAKQRLDNEEQEALRTHERLANQAQMQDRHFQSQLGLDTRSLDLQAKQAKKQARLAKQRLDNEEQMQDRQFQQSRDQMAMQDRQFQSQLGLDTRSLDLQARQVEQQLANDAQRLANEEQEALRTHERLANQAQMQNRQFQSQLGLDTASLELQARQLEQQARQAEQQRTDNFLSAVYGSENVDLRHRDLLERELLKRGGIDMSQVPSLLSAESLAVDDPVEGQRRLAGMLRAGEGNPSLLRQIFAATNLMPLTAPDSEAPSADDISAMLLERLNAGQGLPPEHIEVVRRFMREKNVYDPTYHEPVDVRHTGGSLPPEVVSNLLMGSTPSQGLLKLILEEQKKWEELTKQKRKWTPTLFDFGGGLGTM